MRIDSTMSWSSAWSCAEVPEEPIRPGVEARRVAKLREITPDGEQRLLRRVLGELDVAQNPVRHRMEPIARRNGEAREGRFVAVLCSRHEIGIHASSVRGGSSLGTGPTHTAWASGTMAALNVRPGAQAPRRDARGKRRP
jgi:hypothetical protein